MPPAARFCPRCGRRADDNGLAAVFVFGLFVVGMILVVGLFVRPAQIVPAETPPDNARNRLTNGHASPAVPPLR